jgi:hypothetical protein
MSEYVSHSTPLADHLSGGIDRSLGSLEKMVQALEAYLATAPPTAPKYEEPAGSGPGMTSARTGGTAQVDPADGNQAESPPAEEAVQDLVPAESSKSQENPS